MMELKMQEVDGAQATDRVAEFWNEADRIDVLLVDLKRMRCLLNKQITVYEVKLEEMNAQWDAVARRTYNKTKGVE